MHKLDILFPFHRNDNFFIEALNSILESKFKDYRLILIDDTIENSTKINFDFLTKKEIDYIYLRTPGNVGYGYSLKKGTEYIEAPFVALMNSDDCIHPERFSIQMEFIKDSDLNFCKMKKYSFICILYFSLKAAIEEISLQGSYCSDFQNLQIGFAFRLLH